MGLYFFTKYLNPQKFGEVNLSLTISMLFSQLFFGPLANSTIRYYSLAKKREQIQNFFTSTFFLARKASLLTIVFGVVSIICLKILGLIAWIPIAIVSIIYALVLGYNGLINGMQIAARQRIIVGLHQSLVVWLRFTIGILLFLFLIKTSLFVLIGFLFASFIVFLSQLYFLKKKLPLSFSDKDKSKAWVKRLLRYSLPFSYWGIFTWSLLASDKWALQIFKTSTEVGLYSAAYQFSFAPLILLTGFLEQFIAPIIFERLSRTINRAEAIQAIFKLFLKMILVLLCIMLVIISVTFVFHNSIFSLVIGNQFISASFLLPYMLIAATFFCLGQLLTIYILALKKSSILIPTKIGTAILGSLLNFTGAYYYGLNGVVYALVITYVIYFMCILFLTWSINK